MSVMQQLKKILLLGAFVLVQSSPAFAVSTESVTPHVNDMNRLASELRATQTAQQAQALAAQLDQRLAQIKVNHAQMTASFPAFEKAKAAKTMTPQMRMAAMTVNNLNDNVLPAIEKEMNRVEALYPPIRAEFDILRNLNQ